MEVEEKVSLYPPLPASQPINWGHYLGGFALPVRKKGGGEKVVEEKGLLVIYALPPPTNSLVDGVFLESGDSGKKLLWKEERERRMLRFITFPLLLPLSFRKSH